MYWWNLCVCGVIVVNFQDVYKSYHEELSNYGTYIQDRFQRIGQKDVEKEDAFEFREKLRVLREQVLTGVKRFKKELKGSSGKEDESVERGYREEATRQQAKFKDLRDRLERVKQVKFRHEGEREDEGFMIIDSEASPMKALTYK